MAAHIFLTGEIQVGKSTAIKRFLETTGLRACGFRTLWDEDELRLAPYGAPAGAGAVVAIRGEKGLRKLPHVFDDASGALFEVPYGAEIMIMDELGFLENEDRAFKRRVLESLDGDIPILGVIKPAKTAFLDAVRAHPCVSTVYVDKGNRDEVYERLCRRFGH